MVVSGLQTPRFYVLELVELAFSAYWLAFWFMPVATNVCLFALSHVIQCVSSLNAFYSSSSLLTVSPPLLSSLSSLSLLRIVSCDKLGELFNQTVIPLSHTPRKMAVTKHNFLAIIETDHNCYPASQEKEFRKGLGSVVS